MASPVRIALTAEGIREVKSALVDVRNVLVQIETNSIRQAQAASKKRIEIYRSEARAKQNIAKQFDAMLGGSQGSAPGLRSRGGRGPSGIGGGVPAEGKLNSSMLSMASKIGGAIGAVALFAKGVSMAVDGLKQFGGFLINDILKPQMALEKFAVQMENSSAGAIKSQEVIDKSNRIQRMWNIDAMEAAQAAAQLSDKTGNAQLAFDGLEDLAMLSKAYGAELSELADLSAALYNTSPGMTRQDLQQLLFTQLAQGQVEGGRFTIKDIAGLGGELVKNFAGLAGDADVRMASVGAALQTGGITGKADVSMTNLNSFLLEAGKRLGKGVVNEKGQIADLGNAIRTALVKSGGDMAKLTAIGFTDTSRSFLAQFMGQFQDSIKAGGGKTDMASLNRAAQEATSTFETMRKSTMDEATVRQAANKVMRTSSEQYESAMSAIKDELIKLAPQMKDIVKQLAQKAPQIATSLSALGKAIIGLVEWLVDILPETDTRTKRALQRAVQQAKGVEKAEATGKALDELDKKIAFIQESPVSEETAATLPALQEQRKALAAKLIEQEAGIKEAEKAPEAVTRQALETSLSQNKDAFGTLAWGLAKGTLSGQGDLGSNPLKTWNLSSGDEESVGMLLNAMEANPGSFDFSSEAYGGFNPTQKEALEAYRDQLLTQQEKTVEGGAQKMDFAKLTETANTLAESLKKAAQAADKLGEGGDPSRTAPLGGES